MRTLFLLLLASAVFGQQLVTYNAPLPNNSTLTGSVLIVPFVMPCGATSYTNYSGAYLNCSANWPTNSTFALALNGAADWVKFTGNGSLGASIKKSVASHRISDLSILPPGQSTFAALQLGYYVLPPGGTEPYDFANPALPQRGNASPQSVYTVARYTNCFSGGALVAGCGQSVTVPVANRVNQTYYFAVGTVGRVNGQFRVHLSDSSAPDYVYTDTDALTGTATDSGSQNEKFFTIHMQSVAAGVTATISYTGSNLASGATSAGLAIIAAGMGGQTNGQADPRNLPQELSPGLGSGVYGAQVTVPDSSAIPQTGVYTINVPHVDNSTDAAALQSALTCAIGDCKGNGSQRYDIVLAEGFNSASTIQLNNPAGRTNDWIVIRPATLPTRSDGGPVITGQRVNAADTFHAHIMSNANGDDAIANDHDNTTLARRTAHHFAVIGVEIGFPNSAASTPMYNLVYISGVSLAYPDPVTGITPASYPHHILFERDFVHGFIPSDGVPLMYMAQSGLVTNANTVGVYGCYFSWFSQKGVESKALWWNSSAGPITIKNNYVEANSEGVICCAQAQPTLGHTSTINLVVDHNLFTKNRAEMTQGVTLGEKNHLEVKGGVAGYSITNNVFLNSWSDSQHGQCVALNSHIGVPIYDPLNGLANILVENNYCRAGAGMTINLQEELGQNVPVPSTQFNTAAHIRIHNNWFDLSSVQAGTGQGETTHYCFFFGGEEYGYDVTLDHNTCDYDPADDAAGHSAYSWNMDSNNHGNITGGAAQLARRSTLSFTNNDMPRQPTGQSTTHYGLAISGANMLNNTIGRSGEGGLGKTRTDYDLGRSWYFAAIPAAAGGLGNPRQIGTLGTNYVEGCLLSAYAADGATCIPPPALTYPSPARGADKPMLMAQYCAVVTGNRSDLACTPPH